MNIGMIAKNSMKGHYWKEDFYGNLNMEDIVDADYNKPVYLGLSILELSKIVKCPFWYDYVKPKYGEKAKLCYMDK